MYNHKNCSHYFSLRFNLKAMESYCLEVCYYRGESRDIYIFFFYKIQYLVDCSFDGHEGHQVQQIY